MFRYRTWPVAGRGVSLVALALVVAGCSSNNPTAPPWVVSVPFSSSDVVAGTGDEAIVGKVVVVDYAGWLYNASMAESKGPLFDTSFSRDVFSFELGAGAVIRGWDQGVPGMKVGGQRRLVVPPSLAYGSTGNGPIPPDATLVFDIYLLGVFEPGQVPQATGPGASRPVGRE
jgi:FKBP-type peptidyl-prolyl cis-trans isomerase FkpA